MNSIDFLGTSRAITSLIRLLPVPAPRPVPFPYRGLHLSQRVERRRNTASNDTEQGTSGEQVDVTTTPKKRRRRLDEVCLEQYPEYSRNVIQSWIAQGKVLVNDKAVLKAGTPVPSTANVIITAEQPKFVCRAGLKLEAALDHFKIDPTGFSALDSGLSTGGFTDCLLQRGATRVVGVDVGYGQVAEKVRVDPRVTIMERTNLRHLRLVDLPEAACVDIVTLDLSFISSLKMRETVCDVLKLHGGQLLLLIKPQFEAGKAEVNTGGVVRDPEVVSAAGDKITTLLPQGCPIAATPLDTSPVWDLSADGESSRTLYIMPAGTLSERLAAISSAATLARNAHTNFIVVWPEGGDPDFAAAWSDLYQSPKLPTGPFPNGRYSPINPGCTLHTIKSYKDYQAIEKNWEKVSHNKHEQALCLLSSSTFLPGSKDAAWFYKLLTPSPQVMALVTPFVEEQQWARWGQWIGIHACTTQEFQAVDNPKTAPTSSDFLTVARQFAAMPLDGESVPRFFIVSDDSQQEESIREMIWNMNLTGAKGAAVVFPSNFKFTQPNSVAGLREIAAHLHLLSETVLVIGTPGSTMTTAAAAAGESYLVFAENNGLGSNDLNVTRVELPDKKDVRAALLGGRGRGGLGGGGVDVVKEATVAKSRHMAG